MAYIQLHMGNITESDLGERNTTFIDRVKSLENRIKSLEEKIQERN